MKRIAILLPLILLLSSCAETSQVVTALKTPSAQWAEARQDLSTGEELMVTLHKEKVISDQTLASLDPGVRNAQTALSDAAKLLPAGGSTFDFWIKIVTDENTLLQPSNLTKVETPNAGSTTRSSRVWYPYRDGLGQRTGPDRGFEWGHYAG